MTKLKLAYTEEKFTIYTNNASNLYQILTNIIKYGYYMPV